MFKLSLSILVGFFFLNQLFKINCDQYEIGVGIADITGPAAEVSMMTYGKSYQKSSGIHLRLFSRSFIIVDRVGNRICYVINELGTISQSIRLEVIQRLKKFGGIYNEGNVVLAATHTHSSVGGHFQALIYNIPTQGFVKQNFEVIVNGILRSIEIAHRNIQKGYIYFNKGEVLGVSVNRSPTSYKANPPEERKRYKYDTEKEMQLLKFVSIDGKPIGMLAWFAVHGTSLNASNSLISSDNTGAAALFFEQKMEPNSLPGKNSFVAAFGNSNSGDASPNIGGARCVISKMPCESETSTCGIMAQEIQAKRRFGNKKKKLKLDRHDFLDQCIASGPGKDLFESTKIIAEKLSTKAFELFETANYKISGIVDYIYQNVDMSNVEIVLPNKQVVHTCKPAYGVSFGAGTTDGPGEFGFYQGGLSGTSFTDFLNTYILHPSREIINCQHPKPIMIPTGEMRFPYPWSPTILPTQIIKIGNILIPAIPLEVTTMSGRRLKKAIADEFHRFNPNQNVEVILSCLSNTYASYLTTFEEYQKQRYEAASTIYGPHTLSALIQQYQMLTNHLLLKLQKQLPPGPPIPNFIKRQISFQPGVVFDGTRFGSYFGEVLQDANLEYNSGEIVVVRFVSANPRNDLQTEGTFLTVERYDPQKTQWIIVATDASWETKFIWERTNNLFGESQATVIWEIPKNVIPGIYRIQHFCSSKNLFQRISPFNGRSRIFKVTNKSNWN